MMLAENMGDNHPEWKKHPSERLNPVIFVLFWLGVVAACCTLFTAIGMFIYGNREIGFVLLKWSVASAAAAVSVFILDYFFVLSSRR